MSQWDMAGMWSSAPLFPIIGTGIAGIVVWSVIPGHFVNTRLIIQIGFFLSMSAMLVGSAQLLWWLHLAWALIGFVRIFLVLEGKP